MRAMILSILGLLATHLACAGEGLTTVECTGNNVKVSLFKADGGDSDFKISGKINATYSNYSSHPDNVGPATSVVVLDGKKSVVIGVGLNISNNFTFQEVQLVSISSTYASKKKTSTRGLPDAAFKATLSSSKNDFKDIPLNCQLKYTL